MVWRERTREIGGQVFRERDRLGFSGLEGGCGLGYERERERFVLGIYSEIESNKGFIGF